LNFVAGSTYGISMNQSYKAPKVDIYHGQSGYGSQTPILPYNSSPKYGDEQEYAPMGNSQMQHMSNEYDNGHNIRSQTTLEGNSAIYYS
jgi:hypothetical protein